MLPRLIVFVGLVLALGGCVSLSATLEKDGRLTRCETTGWGWAGLPAAFADQHRCVAELEGQGYTKVTR